MKHISVDTVDSYGHLPSLKVNQWNSPKQSIFKLESIQWTSVSHSYFLQLEDVKNFWTHCPCPAADHQAFQCQWTGLEREETICFNWVCAECCSIYLWNNEAFSTTGVNAQYLWGRVIDLHRNPKPLQKYATPLCTRSVSCNKQCKG